MAKFKAVRKKYFDVWFWDGENTEDFKEFSSHYYVIKPEFDTDLVLQKKYGDNKSFAVPRNCYVVSRESDKHNEIVVLNETEFNNTYII
jgi:hypothetical protein